MVFGSLLPYSISIKFVITFLKYLSHIIKIDLQISSTVHIKHPFKTRKKMQKFNFSWKDATVYLRSVKDNMHVHFGKKQLTSQSQYFSPEETSGTISWHNVEERIMRVRAEFLCKEGV